MFHGKIEQFIKKKFCDLYLSGCGFVQFADIQTPNIIDGDVK